MLGRKSIAGAIPLPIELDFTIKRGQMRPEPLRDFHNRESKLLVSSDNFKFP